MNMFGSDDTTIMVGIKRLHTHTTTALVLIVLAMTRVLDVNCGFASAVSSQSSKHLALVLAISLLQTGVFAWHHVGCRKAAWDARTRHGLQRITVPSAPN